MAASVLVKLYNGEIECEEIISWLLKKETPVALKNCEEHRQLFTQLFLAFLRESSAARKGDVIQSGFTPRKQPVDVDIKGISSESKTDSCRNSNRINAKSNSDVQHARSCSKGFDENRRNKPKFHHHYRSGESRSRQRLSLGNFISPNQENVYSKSKVTNTVSTPINLSKSLNLEDEEAFPSISQAKQKPKFGNTNRRITPTPVVKREPTICSSDPSNAVFDHRFGENESHFSYKEERKLLREEMKSVEVHTMLENADQTKIVKPNVTKIEELKPEDIILKSYVEKLSNLYGALINKSLVPCFSAELYFTIQLLTIPGVKDYNDVDFGMDSVFRNASNCVYFATRVLFLIKELLLFLDKQTIKLLSENSRVESFSPLLQTFLIQHLHLKPVFNHLSISTSNGVNSVVFTADIDHRKHFKNDQEFNNFKKKRDLFYELIREWAANHMDPKWSAEAALGKKIKITVDLGERSASYAHFAQLFQSQLVLTCRDGHLTGLDNEKDLKEDLNSLKSSNIEKLKMLEKRFQIPFKSGEASPLPTFPSYQEFFKLFICQSRSYHFNQHLGNVLSSKITELHVDFVSLVNEFLEESTVVDPANWSKMFSLIKTLKLLAKFLGLVVFLPYQGAEHLTENHLLTNSRNSSVPLFDVRGFLSSSMKSKTLVLAMPWLVDFLSMMDFFAPRISYFRDVLQSCYGVYKFLICIGERTGISYSKFLFRLLLEWLFKVIRSVCDESACDIFMTSTENIDANELRNYGVNIDHLKLFDERVLYLCCPFLMEFKYILSEFNNGVGCNSSSTRKITPISTRTSSSNNSSSPSLSSSQQIQLKLEESFLCYQPTHVKNTIDFVVHRISSNVQRYVNDHIVPKFKSSISDELHKLAVSLRENNEDKQLKLDAAAKSDELSKKITPAIKESAMDYAKSHCFNPISVAIKSLLPDDTSADVEGTIIQIALRRTTERISEWLNGHITESNQYQILTNEIIKLKNQSCINDLDDMEEAEDTIIIVDLFDHEEFFTNYQDVLRRLLTDKDKIIVQNEEIFEILDITNIILQNYHEPNTIIVKHSLRMNINLIIALITRQPEKFDRKLCNSFLKLWMSWKIQLTPFLSTIFSAHHLYLLHHYSLDAKYSWSKLRNLTLKMIKCNLIAKDDFLNSCTIVMQHTLSESFNGFFKSYMKSVAS